MEDVFGLVTGKHECGIFDLSSTSVWLTDDQIFEVLIFLKSLFFLLLSEGGKMFGQLNFDRRGEQFEEYLDHVIVFVVVSINC